MARTVQLHPPKHRRSGAPHIVTTTRTTTSHRVGGGVWVVVVVVIVMAVLVGGSSPPRLTDPTTTTEFAVKQTATTNPKNGTSADADSCTLYLARSTIPGAGLGIFTTVPLQPGDTVGYGDVMIPLVDVWFHWQGSQAQYPNLLHHPGARSLDVTAEYVWYGPELGMTREAAYLGLNQNNNYNNDDDDDDEYVDNEPSNSTVTTTTMIWPAGYETEFILGLAPGLDAAINCHLALNNVDKGPPLYYDDDLLIADATTTTTDTRKSHPPHPGRGASTRYHSSPTVVEHSIPAGGELFKYYGEQWFVSRTESLGPVPLTDDYVAAERLLQKLDGILERHNHRRGSGTDRKNTTTTTNSTTLRRDLWQWLQHWPWGSDTSRTLRVFQSLDYLHWPLVVQRGMRAAQQTKAKRGRKYLQQHGRCLDHLKSVPLSQQQQEPQPTSSTTTTTLEPQQPEASGYGAYATRFLAQGQIITGTPVLLVPSGEFFDMYDGDWYGKTYIQRNSSTQQQQQPIGRQLWINYCWHDANASSIYLCPYGSGVNSINHASSTASSTKRQANARFQWAPDRAMNHNAHRLRTSPKEWYDYHGVSAPDLHVDLVALRDIEAGEEVLVDYGADWERAWQEHVQRWNEALTFELGDDHPSTKAYKNNYESPRAWNRQHAHDVLRTIAEQQDHPYPDNFELYCLPEIVDEEFKLDSVTAQNLWEPSTLGYPCRVTQREWREDDEENGGGAYWYRVEYVDAHVHDPQRNGEWMESNWIVREAMRFEDKPYTTDMFWKHAFRHPMGFPDGMFPEAWRGVFLAPLPVEKPQ